MLLDLECVLRMHQIKRKSTALVIGYLNKNDTTCRSDFDHLAIFISRLFDLRRRGITTFVFTFWGYFEREFLHALSLHRQSADRYLFIGADQYAARIPDKSLFENIIIPSDTAEADIDELTDRLLRNCSTLAYYNTTNIMEMEVVKDMAGKRRMFLLSME